MQRHRSNPSLYQVSTLSRGDLGRRLGWTQTQLRKRLNRARTMPYMTPDHRGRYDARALDLLRALYGQTYDYPDEPDTDWLAVYLRGTHDHTPGPGTSGPS